MMMLNGSVSLASWTAMVFHGEVLVGRIVVVQGLFARGVVVAMGKVTLEVLAPMMMRGPSDRCVEEAEREY